MLRRRERDNTSFEGGKQKWRDSAGLLDFWHAHARKTSINPCETCAWAQTVS